MLWRLSVVVFKVCPLQVLSIGYLNAGTYTPIAYLGLGGSTGKRLLAIVWTGAAAGILQSFFWVKAPKAIATSIYVVLGWAILPHAAEVLSALHTSIHT